MLTLYREKYRANLQNMNVSILFLTFKAANSIATENQVIYTNNFAYFCWVLFPKKKIELEEGDFYLTTEGYKCFTTQYHLKRGYCCESGCRHCPYGFNKKTNTQQ